MEVEGEAKEEEKKPEEASHYTANNPFRVIDHQIPHLVYLSENRYEPILKVKFSSFHYNFLG